MDAVIRPKRVKRRHSEEFKQAVVTACGEPGASVAGIALANGVNANLVRRWMAKRGFTPPSQRPKPSVALAVSPCNTAAAFIPVGVESSACAPSNIQIEMRRGDTALSVSWPVEAAGACAAWIGEWLR